MTEQTSPQEIVERMQGQMTANEDGVMSFDEQAIVVDITGGDVFRFVSVRDEPEMSVRGDTGFGMCSRIEQHTDDGMVAEADNPEPFDVEIKDFAEALEQS